MKLDALDHPKTLDFAARLGVSRPTAIGHLELLWAFVGKLAPQGNVGKFADGAIARASEWQGDPVAFIDALIDAGFLDVDPEHRLLVHDWHDHCPRWVSAKLKKLGISFSERTAGASAVATTVATTVPSPCARATPGVGKGREGKCVYAHTREATAVPTAERTPDPQPAEGNREPDPPPPAPRTTLTLSDQEFLEAFTEIREHYPHKAGRQDWITAEHHWRIRLEEGVSIESLLAAVKRYRAYVAAGGVSSSAYVLGPEKFFSAADKPWAQAWALPVKQLSTDAHRDELLRRVNFAGGKA